MISRLYLSNIDLENETMCTTLEDVDAPIEAGMTLNANIQSIMTYIDQGEPKVTYDTSKGNSIFVNAYTCLPAAKYTVRTLNYLEVTCERNSSFTDLLEVRYEGDEKIYYLPKGTKFQCKFANGKMSIPTINTNTFIDGKG